jgi:signal transduction histidine kinase
MLPDYRVRQRDYLLEILRALTKELDLPVLLTRILRITVEMLSGHAGFIALLDDDRGWHIAVHQGLPEALYSYIENWMAMLPEEMGEDGARVPEMNKMLSDISMGMISSVGISMIAQGQVIGQIYVFRNYRTTFSQNDYSLLNSFANQAAIAVRNAKLYKEIKDHNLRTTALLDSVADGIVILGPDLHVVRVNAAFCKLINASPGSLLGQSYESVFQWQGVKKGLPIDEACHDWRCHHREEMFIEGDMKRLGGLPPLPVSINYAPLFTSDGSLLNIIASVRDISRHRAAEDLKTGFMSVISHELKTPIALIKGYASTLRRDDVNWDKSMVDESLAVIEDEADHLAAMVEDLLDATRLQAGGLALRPTELDIDALVEDLLKKHTLEAKHQPLITHLPHDFPLVYADPTRINQLLTNLISNSLKYADNGSIEVSGVAYDDAVKICVADHGPGFDPIDVPHAFDRFYRADHSSKTTKGTGLGLFLSKSIVEAHGGKIWIDETYRAGAKICFTLPRFFPKPL